jgi:hypothetical protein
LTQCAAPAIAIIEKVAPLLGAFLRAWSESGPNFLMNEIVTLFRRSYLAGKEADRNRIWEVWGQFCCAPDPGNWVDLFSAAYLLLEFGNIVKKVPVGIPDMDEMRGMTLWLAKEAAMPAVRLEPVMEEVPAFRYFAVHPG